MIKFLYAMFSSSEPFSPVDGALQLPSTTWLARVN